MAAPTADPCEPGASREAEALRILVLGVGNPLMRDDGFGPRVIELLRLGYRFPDNVHVLDAGTMSFAILNIITEADHMIVVDAVKDTDVSPGTVLRFTPEEMASNQLARSGHDLRLVDVLQAAALIGNAPDTVAIGVQIAEIAEFVLELSEAVERAVPIAAGAVLDELARLGIRPEKDERHPEVHERIAEALRTYSPMTDVDGR
ncbi:MAG: hydrogenase maturation protease [Coriobacteriia bacterium]